MTEEHAFIEWKAEQYKHQNTEEEMEFVEHLHYFPKYFKKTFLDGYHECEKEHEWHDLEKDPNDLPKDNKQYLVMFRYNYKGKAEERYGVRDNLKDDFAVHRCYTEQIIKWKEIE